MVTEIACMIAGAMILIIAVAFGVQLTWIILEGIIHWIKKDARKGRWFDVILGVCFFILIVSAIVGLVSIPLTELYQRHLS